MGQLISLQYLRALAALAVVVRHTEWLGPRVGQQGVDVFFIISGFVMALVVRPDTSAAGFLAARARRVVPLYWVVTLAWCALHPETMRHAALSMAFVPHASEQGGFWPVLWQGWTLDFEVFFYGSVAVALLVSRRWLEWLTAGLLALVALGGALGGVLPGSAAVNTYTSPLLVEFLAGAWLCRVRVRHRFGLVAVGLAAAWFVAGARFDPTDLATGFAGVGFARLAVYGVPSLLLVAGVVALEGRGWLPRVGAGLLVGDASYAIYLTHGFFVGELAHAVRGLPLPAALGVVLGCAVGVGLLVHLGVERPLGRALRQRVAGV